MTALAANRELDRFVDQELRSLPLAASEVIYKGAYVGKNPAGYFKAFVPGDEFAGIAYEAATATTTAGAVSCRVFTLGDFVLPLTSVAQKDVGKAVYATDDATLALTGHPDAFVGRILAVHATNYALVRLRQPGEKPNPGEGSVELVLTGHENFTETGATAGTSCVGGFDLKSILGTGWVCNDAEDGGIKGDFDAVAEVALASCRQRNDTLPVDKGVTLDVDLVVADSGDNAALDIDFGFGTALTTNSEADIDHGDMAQLAAFHLDGNSDDILAQSDDATTDVAAVDTTKNNDSSTDVPKHFKIIVRPSGAVEFWIDGVRVLPTTTFAVLSTALLAAFINMEKTSNDTTASIIFRNLRVAGGMGMAA
jgi:predicted RecA/RadA family phage recombinase